MIIFFPDSIIIPYDQKPLSKITRQQNISKGNWNAFSSGEEQRFMCGHVVYIWNSKYINASKLLFY